MTFLVGKNRTAFGLQWFDSRSCRHFGEAGCTKSADFVRKQSALAVDVLDLRQIQNMPIAATSADRLSTLEANICERLLKG